jgi:hypothetical protein
MLIRTTVYPGITAEWNSVSQPDEGEMNSDGDGSSAFGEYEELKKYYQITE